MIDILPLSARPLDDIQVVGGAAPQRGPTPTAKSIPDSLGEYSRLAPDAGASSRPLLAAPTQQLREADAVAAFIGAMLARLSGALDAPSASPTDTTDGVDGAVAARSTADADATKAPYRNSDDRRADVLAALGQVAMSFYLSGLKLMEQASQRQLQSVALEASAKRAQGAERFNYAVAAGTMSFGLTAAGATQSFRGHASQAKTLLQTKPKLDEARLLQAGLSQAGPHAEDMLKTNGSRIKAAEQLVERGQLRAQKLQTSGTLLGATGQPIGEVLRGSGELSVANQGAIESEQRAERDVSGQTFEVLRSVREKLLQLNEQIQQAMNRMQDSGIGVLDAVSRARG